MPQIDVLRVLWMSAVVLLVAASGAGAEPQRPERARRPPPRALEAFDTLDLENLLALEVSVASIKAVSLRESPGIVTVITRQEILSWGARDLIDVLSLVPGFFFGVDVQGAVGIGIRGNWAHEGKILLLLDGFEMNELNYQTLQLGHRIPVEAIDRVEIIRGPGSAIYGGNAELGVIHVRTRRAESIEGGRVALKYGTPSRFSEEGDDTGFLDATVEAGLTQERFAWSLSAQAGRSVRSEAEYVPLVGDPYNMADASEIRSLMVNGSVRLDSTELRVLYDGYGYDSRDAFDEPTPLVQAYDFSGFYADLTSRIDIAEGVSLIPRLSFKRQLAYNSDIASPEQREEALEFGTFLEQATLRGLGSLVLSWDMFPGTNLIVGAEVSYDRGDRLDDSEDVLAENSYFDDEGQPIDRIEFLYGTAYAQLLWLNEVVNITAGGRVEVHSAFGLFAVPRLALTKVFDFGLHAKLLAAQAFRTPGIQNESLDKQIDPTNEIERERTTVFESEIGYQLMEGFQITANGFYTIIEDPIIYVFEEEGNLESYFNRDKLETAGGELQLTYRGRHLQGEMGYGTYFEVGKDIEDYAVEGSTARLGAPQHKITARISWEPLPGFRITPVAVFQAVRYGFATPEAEAPERLDDQLFLGVGLTGEDVGVTGLDLGLFAHNLLDETSTFIQPYTGGHGVLPGPGRQFLLRLSFQYER